MAQAACPVPAETLTDVNGKTIRAEQANGDTVFFTPFSAGSANRLYHAKRMGSDCSVHSMDVEYWDGQKLQRDTGEDAALACMELKVSKNRVDCLSHGGAWYNNEMRYRVVRNSVQLQSQTEIRLDKKNATTLEYKRKP